MSKAWFVTGASSGMSRGLARFAAHLRRQTG
jgi:NAD(P)-dependent dehydrogenase (short-subunit alcohol dehydrogenase family)